MRGKVLFAAPPQIPERDHPRACGEKVDEITRFHIVQGSPPRMRGKVPIDSASVEQWGITPAHAGKRVNIPSIASLNWDHPRACGEKAKKIP